MGLILQKKLILTHHIGWLRKKFYVARNIQILLLDRKSRPRLRNKLLLCTTRVRFILAYRDLIWSTSWCANMKSLEVLRSKTYQELPGIWNDWYPGRTSKNANKVDHGESKKLSKLAGTRLCTLLMAYYNTIPTSC